MPSFVTPADLPCLDDRSAEKSVDQRGFSHARGTDKSAGLPFFKVGAEFFTKILIGHGKGDHIGKAGDRLDLRDRLPEIFAKIGFRQHDHRCCAAVPGHGKVPLHAVQTEIPIE